MRTILLARPCRLLLLVSLVSLVSPLHAPAAGSKSDEGGAWTTLSALRQGMIQAGPLGARFVQTYVPAGFTSGEKETGTLALALPDCLRWDYTEPYPKSFLVCGETAHYWNPEDHSGQRYSVDRKKEPGLDLVLLGVGELEERYQAREKPTDGGRVEVTLTAPGEEGREIRKATLLVDPGAERLLALSYEDAEGNLTRFEISDYHPLADRGAFTPPDGIAWKEGEP